MAKYQGLPKIVEATQWFPGVALEGLSEHTDWDGETKYGIVETIHGQKTKVVSGDYVITEPDGIHHYPCKPDIFDKNYRSFVGEGSPISQSVDVLKQQLKADPDFWQAWKANIAMAFFDSYQNFDIEHERPLNSKDIHQIANSAAQYFLNELTR